MYICVYVCTFEGANNPIYIFFQFLQVVFSLIVRLRYTYDANQCREKKSIVLEALGEVLNHKEVSQNF